MIRTLLALTALLSAASAHAAPTRVWPDHLPRVLHHTLTNGLEVYLVPSAGNPLLEIQLGFKVGSGADPIGREGTASLLGRLATAGLPDLPEQALAKELAKLGAHIAADVGFESMTIGGQVPTFSERDVRRYLELFASSIFDNPLPAEVLEREKALRLGLLTRVTTNAEALAELAGRMVATPGAWGRPSFGTFASIPAVTRDDLVALRDRAFAPSQAVLVVGGAFDEAAMLAWLEERFGTWRTPVTLEAGPLPGRARRLCRDGRCLDNLAATPPAAPLGKETLLVTVDDPNLAQIPYRLATRNPIAMLDPRWASFRLGTFALGGDFTSRLMQTLRVREGLTYGAYFSPDFGGHVSGAMMVGSDGTPDALTRAITLARAELDRIATTPIPDDELAMNRAVLVEGFAFKLETFSKTMEQLLGLCLAEVPPEWLARWRELLAAPDARAVAATMGGVASDKMTLVVAGPEALATELKALGHGRLRVVSAKDLLTTGLENAAPR